jgi:hypothetical protein
VSVNYYGMLDSVRLAADSADTDQRRLMANAVLMLDILVGGQVPVLQQGQVFDNVLLLDAVAEGGDDSDAILKLIEGNAIQMRIFDSPDLMPQSTDDERFTLMNAFVSRLAGTPSFIFSAWPELADPDARELLSRVLRGQSKEPLPGPLNDRVFAVKRLDAAFRRSTAREQATPVKGVDLEALVVADVRHRPESSAGTAALNRELGQVLRIRERDPATFALSTRSGWYRALDEYGLAEGRSPDHPRLAQLRELVDQHYNVIVARSLRADRAVSAAAREGATVLEGSDLPAGVVAQAGVLLDGAARADWLEWRSVPERLEAWEHLSAEDRAERLLEERLIAVESSDGRVAYVRSLPTRVHDSVVSLSGGLIGSAAGGLTEGDPSGLIAGLISAAVAPFLYRLTHLDRVVDRVVAPLAEGARNRARRKTLEADRIVISTADRAGNGGAGGDH